MVLAIKIQSNAKQVVTNFGKLNVKIKQFSEKTPKDLAELTASELKKSLRRNSKKFDGKIYRSIKAKRKNKQNYYVGIAQEGVFLDSMKPHVVWLKRGRKITKWAKQRGVRGFIMKRLSAKTGKQERGIFVRPHPFIGEGIAKATIKYRNKIKQNLSQIIRK